jgi:hypothetical protein
MFAFTTDTLTLWVYNGAAWQTAGGGSGDNDQIVIGVQVFS